MMTTGCAWDYSVCERSRMECRRKLSGLSLQTWPPVRYLPGFFNLDVPLQIIAHGHYWPHETCGRTRFMSCSTETWLFCGRRYELLNPPHTLSRRWRQQQVTLWCVCSVSAIWLRAIVHSAVFLFRLNRVADLRCHETEHDRPSDGMLVRILNHLIRFNFIALIDDRYLRMTHKLWLIDALLASRYSYCAKCLRIYALTFAIVIAVFDGRPLNAKSTTLKKRQENKKKKSYIAPKLPWHVYVEVMLVKLNCVSLSVHQFVVCRVSNGPV